MKSPSAAMHLAGTKKVQQVLAAPGTLERFVKDPETAAEMRRVFAGLYALDGEGAAEAVKLGLTDPERYVLKPQREGGGNNLYGEELRAALETFDPASKPGEPGNLSAYILMQRIFPPANRTLCLRNGELSELETLSELGVYGGYLRVGEEVVMNEGGGAPAPNQGGDERRGRGRRGIRRAGQSYAVLSARSERRGGTKNVAHEWSRVLSSPRAVRVARCLPIRLTRTPKLGVVPERPVVSQIMSISFLVCQSSHPNRHVYDERSNGPLVQKNPNDHKPGDHGFGVKRI